MTRYFAQNTPRAGLEHMMMSVPGFQKRGGGMMILSRFCYKPEDVDCRYCLHYRRRSCQVRTCPYIAERLKSGAIEYLDLILEYFGHIPHAGLHKRIQAVEHWSGPDQAVLHTVSVHLRSRFADRVWDDAPPGYWDITDEEYLAQLETKREEITHEILERCRTKRKNLYITGPVALNVAQKFSVHRLCDKEGKHNLANRFVGELMEQLVQDGLLVTRKTRNGPGVRTATDAEISSPLPGQQQMTL